MTGGRGGQQRPGVKVRVRKDTEAECPGTRHSARIKAATVGKELGCRSHSGSEFMKMLQTVYDKVE